MPQDIPKNTIMKTGEIFGKEGKRGIVFGNWKDSETLHTFLRGTVY